MVRARSIRTWLVCRRRTIPGYHWPSILSSVTATDRPWSGLPVPVTTTWPLTMSSRSAVRVGHASDLNLDPGGHVYATRAQHDIIHLVAGAALGPNPTWDGFGAVELQAAPGPALGPEILNLPSVAAHSSYWDDDGNPALLNMGAIIAGKPPPYVVPPN